MTKSIINTIKIIASILVVMSCIVILPSCLSSESKPEVVLKLCHSANEQDIWHKSVTYFAHLADSLSGGKIQVKLYSSELLGKELDMIRSIKAGIDDMTITGESMQNWAPITAFCGMPYLIRDIDHLKYVVQSEVGKTIEEEMIQKIGLRPLGYFPRGPRHLTSNRPITSPDDLQGIILRVPAVPISVKTWDALGAKSTPMTFSEVFTGLQQGSIEAQENPLSLIKSAGLYEVQKYLNLTSHVVGWVYVVIGEKQFQALTLQHQHILQFAGQKAQKYHEKLFLNNEKELKSFLKEKGMKFQEVDLKAFQTKAMEAVENSIPMEIHPYYKQIISMPLSNESIR
jgi:TRAP-type transport system periplasmic protein